MKKIALFLTLGFFLISPAYGQDTIPEEKKVLIKEFLDVTGTKQNAFNTAAYITSTGIKDMRAANPDVDPTAFDEVEEELLNLINEEMQKDTYLEIYYPIYEKYFTVDELKELIAFYKTPLGTKVVKALPQITQETMVVSDAWTRALKPKFRERLQRRLEQIEKEKKEQDKYEAGKAK